MKIVYIAGPYRARTEWEIKKNIDAAEKVALNYWLRGYAVFCPHKNTGFMGGAAPDSVWLEGDLEILGRCDVIVMMSGWERSEGAKAELAHAKARGLEVVYD